MVDIFSVEKRSQIMSQIKSRDSKQELFIRKITHSMGYRYRLHNKIFPGKPDLVFPKYKKVIFVNGCFWHGHQNCKRATLPSTNTEFWKSKISGNIKRDEITYSALRKLGWQYLIIWQCQIKESNKEMLKDIISKFFAG